MTTQLALTDREIATLRFLREGLFADFKIETSTCTFLVHKSLLFSGSGYFQCLLLGDNIETKQSKVKIDDIPASLVARLIMHCYRPDTYPATICASEFAVIPRDSAQSAAKMRSDGPQNNEILVDDMAPVTPDKSFIIASDAIRLYEVADRFLMPTFKRQAAEEFLKTWAHIIGQSTDYVTTDRTGTILPFSEGFTSLVQAVYEATPPGNQLLKNIVIRSVKHLFTHDYHFAERYKFLEQLVEEVDGLAVDLCIYNLSLDKYNCDSCAKTGRHVKRLCSCEKREFWCEQEKCRAQRKEDSFCHNCGRIGTLNPVKNE